MISATTAGWGAAAPVFSHSPSLDGLRLALFTDTYAPHLNGVTRTLERLVAEVQRRGGAACRAPRR